MTDQDQSPLGPNLRQYRLKADLSQEQVARELEVTSMSVSRWERGVSTPGWDTLNQLANLYGTQVPEFYMPVGETNTETESA